MRSLHVHTESESQRGTKAPTRSQGQAEWSKYTQEVGRKLKVMGGPLRWTAWLSKSVGEMEPAPEVEKSR